MKYQIFNTYDRYFDGGKCIDNLNSEHLFKYLTHSSSRTVSLYNKCVNWHPNNIYKKMKRKNHEFNRLQETVFQWI